VRRDEHISSDLPDPGVGASRTILELTWGDDQRYIMKGPERVALTGRNGVGKTTLIETMLGLRTVGTVPTVQTATVGTVPTVRTVKTLLTWPNPTISHRKP